MVHRCTKHNPYFRTVVSLHNFQKKEPELLGKMASSKTVAENVQDKPGILGHSKPLAIYKSAIFI